VSSRKPQNPGSSGDLAAMLSDGLGHHQSGRLEEADAMYRLILTADPEHADANHFLGVLCFQAGRDETAAALIEKSLTTAPDNADALNNLGQVYEGLGRAEEAAGIYRKALALAPEFPAALANLGGILLAAGKTGDAIGFLEKALTADPDDPEVLSALGRALVDEGNPQQALRHFERARDMAPGDPEIQNNMGIALRALGRGNDAVAAFRGALQSAPGFAEAGHNLGLALLERGAFGEATGVFEQLLTAAPDDIEVLNALGMARDGTGGKEAMKGAEEAFERALVLAPDRSDVSWNLSKFLINYERFDDAIAVLDRAVHAAPDSAEALINFAHVVTMNYGKGLNSPALLEQAVAILERQNEAEPGLIRLISALAMGRWKQERLDDALLLYRQALVLDPDKEATHVNMGLVLRETGQTAEAIECFARALEINPDLADAHHGLGIALLSLGRLDEGWQEVEWRWQQKKYYLLEKPSQTPWVGEPLAGKAILVWGEQGIGDQILFATLIPELIETGATVLLYVYPRLVSLFQRSFPTARCASYDDDILDVAYDDEAADYQVPITELARWLRPNLQSFPDATAPLAADMKIRDAFRAKYKNGGDLLVGLSWYSKAPVTGRLKTMALSDLVPLAEIPGVKFIDLQYGDTEKSRQEFERLTGVEVLHDDSVDQMIDMDTFTAQVAALDLVITISNTTAHVAGALGVPTWVMLNTFPLNYWMLERQDSPWYSSARLFRQRRPGRWDDVIGRVAGELAEFKP